MGDIKLQFVGTRYTLIVINYNIQYSMYVLRITIPLLKVVMKQRKSTKSLCFVYMFSSSVQLETKISLFSKPREDF